MAASLSFIVFLFLPGAKLPQMYQTAAKGNKGAEFFSELCDEDEDRHEGDFDEKNCYFCFSAC